VAAKHSTWLHWRGGRDIPGRYQQIARQLMGEVAERARNGDLSVLAREVALSDGAVVRAEMVGAIPRVSVRPPPVNRTTTLDVPALLGFVTKPRRFGDPFDPVPIDTTDGENVYGQEAHVILRDRTPDAEAPSWSTRFFDISYLPEGDTARYGKTFPIGLVNAGNVDWRDAEEKLSVTWIGATARNLANPGVFQGYVFHNGRLILDLWDNIEGDAPIDANRAVNCACLKVIGTDLWLYWLAVPFLFDASALRLCRAKLRPHPDVPWPFTTALYAPQLDLVRIADVEEVYVLDNTADIDTPYGCTQGAFNQAATEMRVICISTELTGGAEVLHSDELRIDFADPDAIAASATRSTVSTVRETNYSLHTYQPNSWRDSDANTLIGWPAFTSGATPRTETQLLDPVLALGDCGWSGPGSANNPSSSSYRAAIVMDGSASVSETRTGTAIPIGIDFQADVPVRALWQPAEGSGTASAARTFTNTNTRSGSRDIYYNLSDLPGEAERNVEHHFTYDVTVDIASATSSSGGRFYVQVEGEDPRFELQWSSSSSTSQTSVYGYAGDQTCTGTQAAGEGMTTYIPWADLTVDAATTAEITSTRTAAEDTTNHAVLFLDLRSLSITVLTETLAYTESATLTVSDSETLSGPPINVQQEWDAIPILDDAELETVRTGGVERTWALSVTFGGAEVFTDTFTDTESLAGSTATTADLRATPTLNVPLSLNTPDLLGYAGTIASRMSSTAAYTPTKVEAQALADAVLDGTDDYGNVFGQTTATPATVIGDATVGQFPFFAEVSWVESSVSTAFWADAATLFGNYWMFDQPDTDTRTTTNLALPKGGGTWIHYRGRWAYSLPWPDGAGNLATARWIDGISPEEDVRTLFDLTGARDDPGVPQLYSPLWPLSLCIVRVPEGLTQNDLKDI
jgi:hypothetical protein